MDYTASTVCTYIAAYQIYIRYKELTSKYVNLTISPVSCFRTAKKDKSCHQDGNLHPLSVMAENMYL